MSKLFIVLIFVFSTSSFAIESKPLSSYGRIGFDDDRQEITIEGGPVYPMTETLTDEWNKIKDLKYKMDVENCKAKINQIYVAKDGWESTIINQLFGIKCKALSN